MRLFDMDERVNNKKTDKELLKKKRATKKTTTVVKSSSGLLGVIQVINSVVNKYLSKYITKYNCITNENKEDLIPFIDACIKNDLFAVDTETTGLDPMSDKIVGMSLATKGQKAIYIPINHVSYITGVLSKNNIEKSFLKEQLEKLINTKNTMFNANFDIRMIQQLGVTFDCWWDCQIGAHLLNENEPQADLKNLHKKYVMKGEEDAFRFGDLFKGITFDKVPIKSAYVYGAHDADITLEYCEYQMEFLTEGKEKCKKHGLEKVAKLFREIEMPCVKIVVEMENAGILLDKKVCEKLSKKYNELLVDKKKCFYSECDKFDAKIEKYKNKHQLDCKLDNPINIASPKQLAILLYDILEIPSVSKKEPRGTGVEILEKIDNPISKSILEVRKEEKLISTYIDKMPKIVNSKTGKVHCKFNQAKTDTGRFSSSEPNMQNIPSHNKDIRQMFCASDGYVLLSSDYSAQEPRLTAVMSGDEKMIQAYKDGKDVYVEIASLAFDVPYEECLEEKNGEFYKEGKERRGKAKAIVLGINYSKGVPAIAEDLNISVKKAQQIYDRVMTLFPGLKQFQDDTIHMAETLGYVDTYWGRKRRLPEMMLPKYEFTYKEGVPKDFDPLLDDFTEDDFDYTVDEKSIQKYTRLLDRTSYFKQRIKIYKMAEEENILIKDNSRIISDATRKCVNARIQGSAADLTKKAMILIGNNERLKQLGFRLLLQVHDELIGECPTENLKEVAKIFPNLMLEAAKELPIPMKCDLEIMKNWYGKEIII